MNVGIQREEENNFDRNIIEMCNNEPKLFFINIYEKHGGSKQAEGIRHRVRRCITTDCIYKRK